LVAVRVCAEGPAERIAISPQRSREAFENIAKPAWFGLDRPLETKVIHRDGLTEESKLLGPTIVLGEDATVLLSPGVAGRRRCSS